MLKKFLWLEWKAFTRSKAFGVNLVLKIILGLIGALYSISFLFASAGAFYMIKGSTHQDPVLLVSQFLIYYFLIDLLIKSLMQKLPVINTRSLLTLPIKRKTIVNFALGKTLVSFFNLVHIFLMVPFIIVLFIEGYNPVGVLFWWLGLWLLVYINNMLNLLMSESDFVFIILLGILGTLVGLHYYDYFDVTQFTGGFFYGLYNTYYMIAIPIAVFAGLWIYAHKYFSQKMYLDTGLKNEA